MKIEEKIDEKKQVLQQEISAKTAVFIAQSETKNNIQDRPVRSFTILSRKKIIMKLCKIGFPLSLVGSLRIVESFFIVNFLSQVGKEALAADGLLTLYLTFLMSSNAILLDPIPITMIGQSYGSGNKEEVGKIVQEGWILTGILSIPIITGLCIAEPILNSLDQAPELTKTVGMYAMVISPAVPALLGQIIDNNFLKSIGKEYNLVPVQIFSVFVGVGMSYILVLGKLGCPALGAVGVGYALTIQSLLSMIITKIYFYLSSDFEPYNLYHFSCRTPVHLKKMLKLGLPLWVLSIVDQGANFTVGIMMGWLGTKQLAIYQCISLYMRMSNMPIDGLRQSNQICMSQFKGMKDYQNMQRFAYTNIAAVTSFNLIPLIIFSSCSSQLASYFIDDETLDEFESYIRLVFITKTIANILEVVRGCLSENLNVLFDTMYPTIVQIISSLTISLPLSYLMAFVFGWQLTGLNIAASVAIGINIPIIINRLITAFKTTITNDKALIEDLILSSSNGEESNLSDVRSFSSIEANDVLINDIKNINEENKLASSVTKINNDYVNSDDPSKEHMTENVALVTRKNSMLLHYKNLTEHSNLNRVSASNSVIELTSKNLTVGGTA